MSHQQHLQKYPGTLPSGSCQALCRVGAGRIRTFQKYFQQSGLKNKLFPKSLIAEMDDSDTLDMVIDRDCLTASGSQTPLKQDIVESFI